MGSPVLGEPMRRLIQPTLATLPDPLTLCPAIKSIALQRFNGLRLEIRLFRAGQSAETGHPPAAACLQPTGHPRRYDGKSLSVGSS